MKNEIIKQHKAKSAKIRRLCMFLALFMAFGAVVPIFTASADDGDGVLTEAQSRTAEIREILNAVPYPEYLIANSANYLEANGKMPMGSGEIVIKPSDYAADYSTAKDMKILEQGDNFIEDERKSEKIDRKAIYSPDEGSVSFKFNVEKEGLYNLSFTYMQVVGKASAIERMIKIGTTDANGKFVSKVPFRESRYLTFVKSYVDVYEEDGSFTKDIKDNEIRPPKKESPEWRTVLAEDASGLIEESFLYYLKAGENILTLEASREAVYISEIKFYVAPEIPTYEQYRASFPDKKGTADIERIQAQYPVATSEVVIFAQNDRTSAITYPQDASRIRLNSIGGTRWQTYGQWIKYEFEVPVGGAGFYYVVPRFKQSIYSGVYSSRRIRINGEIPFKEAGRLRFNFSDSWQVEPVSNGDMIGEGKDAQKRYFEFYFEEGKNVIEFEVVLGEMSELLGRVEDSIRHLNEMYRKIRMITGATPDNNRDYGFGRQIPKVLEGLLDESINLYAISKEFEEIIGGKGEQTILLDKVAYQLERMAVNTDRIAPGLDTLKSNIGGLATWLLERKNQPLELDYIQIHKIDEKMPKPEANFFQAVAFEFKAFIMSFFADYNSQGMMSEITKDSASVEVWYVGGRDQAQIQRQMVIAFTNKTDIQVNLKLVADGALLPAVLAGVGPDINLNGGDAINYAIRSAVLPLNYAVDKETGERTKVEYSKGDAARGIASFDEVRGLNGNTGFFTESAWVPMTLQDESVTDKNQLQVFALPVTQSFPMLFYRMDILVDLGLDLPKTWDDLYKIVPVLQSNKFDIGMKPGLGTTLMFMTQERVPLYKGDGIETNMDVDVALDSFKKMINLYTIYKFPTVYDDANRFREGTMPLMVADYGMYNTLTVFATEIRGLWEFVPMIGTIRDKTPEDVGKGFAETEDGRIIDNTVVPTTGNVIMMRSSAEKKNEDNAWAFMQWWVGAEAQTTFGNEQVAIMGPAAKYATANLEALASQPWPTADFKSLQEQFKHLEGIPQVPGSYIVDRLIDFAWQRVYNDGLSAIDELQDQIPEINKELTRKRQEFGMPIIERDKLGRRILAEK